MPISNTPDLFSVADQPPDRGSTHGLTISALAGAALGPEQRKYNQLVAKVEKARADLQAWEDAARGFASEHARLMRPLIAELAAQRRQLALKLAAVLAHQGQGGVSKRNRGTLKRRLCDEAALLADSEFISKEDAAELEALYDKFSDTPLADERREALADMKDMLETMSGVNLGDADFDTEEDLMRHAQQRVQAAAAAGQGLPPSGADAEFAFGNWQTPNQRKRKKKLEQKKAGEAAQATQSVREVFRKLASALHPDRAADDADRARRTALMQRVNQAYAAQDLLALFTLQLEIEQIDPEHLARAGSERIGHYNRVLGAQLAQLQDEIRQRKHAFALDFSTDPWIRLDARTLGTVLQDELRDIRGALNRVKVDLHDLEDAAGVKRFAQRERVQQTMDDDPFDLPF